MPMDGAYITVVAERSIDSIATEYHVDPYNIIDSDYNDFFGDTPDTVLPSGTKVVIPGGTAQSIVWKSALCSVFPRIRVRAAAAAQKSRSIQATPEAAAWSITPAAAAAGCLRSPATCGCAASVRFHSGVDLSAPIGTPIMAANGGTVIFAGWSNWGYGWSVVLAHGPFTTVYGHMSAVYAKCAARRERGAGDRRGRFERRFDRTASPLRDSLQRHPDRPDQHDPVPSIKAEQVVRC